MKIHPSAIVHPKATLDTDVEVGPFCVVGEHVVIGKGSRLHSHVNVEGWTEIGERNEVHPFASIGGPPQHLAYKGEPTKVTIGHDNIIREYVTINRGTVQGGGVTSLGSKGILMAYVHVAHDCRVGDHTVFANHATLAGHVDIGDWAILGGFTGVHQFCRVGAHSFCGVGTVLLQDLPPFVICAGNPAVPRSINAEGLKRRGYAAEAIAAIKRAYKILYRNGLSLDDARTQIAGAAEVTPELAPLVAFLAESGRGVIR